MFIRRFPWIAHQVWQDVLFIHTPISLNTLRKYVPAPFTIDTYEGQSWVSIVLFRAKKSRLRYMPERFSYPSFYQMNIRTYVDFGGERGVFFFSINANSLLSATGGSAVSLPFKTAPMSINKQNNHFVFYGEKMPAGQKGTLHVSYQPHSPVFKPDPSSLSHFLTERYCIWLIRGNRLVKAPISHTPWQLQQVHTTIRHNQHFCFPFTNETFSHYGDFKHTVIYPFENVGMFSDEVADK